MTLLDSPSTSVADFVRGVPGVYPGIAAPIYHALDAASASRLNDMAQTPLHCYRALTEPRNETPAMKLGTAAHLAILQPEYFQSTYVAAGPCCAVKKSDGATCGHPGKNLVGGKWYCDVRGHAPDGDRDTSKIELSPDEYKACLESHRMIWSKPVPRRALSMASHKELSVLWIDPATKLLCKLRADLIAGTMAFDVKTTNNAAADSFAWKIADMGYHRQAAFYLRGLNASGIETTAFTFLAVEVAPPHCNGVACYSLDDRDLYQGDEEMTGLLATFAKYRTIKTPWPDYSEKIEPIRLPPSKRRDI